MTIVDAFLGRTAGPRIAAGDVPKVHETMYHGDYKTWAPDVEILERWLMQQGISASELGTKTWAEWSRLKTNYYDHGIVPPSYHLDGVPSAADDAGWADTLNEYGIFRTEEQTRVHDAWDTFQEKFYLASDDIRCNCRQGGQNTVCNIRPIYKRVHCK